MKIQVPAQAGKQSKVRGSMSNDELYENEHVSLCEVLDRILNKGAVIVGDVIISVADIDLVYLGLQIVLTSVETARHKMCLVQ